MSAWDAPGDLDLNDLRCLVSLSAHGHFGRAAADLHLSTSALSRRLSRLEASIGTSLVERDHGGYQGLTAAGRRFCSSATAILVAASAAMAAARSRQGPHHITIGSPGLSAGPATRLGERLQTIVRRRNPQIAITARAIPFTHMWDCVHDGRVDVLFNCCPSPTPGVESVPVGSVERIGVVGPKHRLARATSISALELAEHPLLFDPRLPPDWMTPWWLGDLRQEKAAKLQPIAASGMADALRRLDSGEAAVVTQPVFGAVMGPWHLIRLDGAPRVATYADRRIGDRRPAVRAAIDAFRTMIIDLPPRARTTPSVPARHVG